MYVIKNIDQLEARLRSLSLWTKSEQLEREYAVSGSMIRQLNVKLAEQGIVIASSPKGYKRIFEPKNGEALNEEDAQTLRATLNNYYKRGISIFKHGRNIEKKFYQRYSQEGLPFEEFKSPSTEALEEIEKLIK